MPTESDASQGFLQGWLAQTHKMLKSTLSSANGWQRLWIVGSTVWVIFILLKIITQWPELISKQQTPQFSEYSGISGSNDPYCLQSNIIDWTTTQSNIWIFSLTNIGLLVLIPILAYGLGVACSWISAGFEKRNSNLP